MVTRRSLLGKGAAAGAALAAAAVALPAAVTHAAEQVPADVTGHTGECFHKVYKRQVDRSGLDALNERFMASLTDEQRRMYLDISSDDGNGWCDEQAAFVEEVARHFPGLAPAIRAVAYHHLFEQRLDERGVCCGENA